MGVMTVSIIKNYTKNNKNLRSNLADSNNYMTIAIASYKSAFDKIIITAHCFRSICQE